MGEEFEGEAQAIKKSLNVQKVKLYPYQSESFELFDNRGGGDCLFFAFAKAFNVPPEREDAVVKLYRNITVQGLEELEDEQVKAEMPKIFSSGEEELKLTEEVYGNLLALIEEEDIKQIPGDVSTSYQKWRYYKRNIVTRSCGWGNQMLWRAWMQSSSNEYKIPNLYTLNCLLIDQTVSQFGERGRPEDQVSRVVCCSSDPENKSLPKFWFIILRTKVNRKNYEGWGADHYVNLKFKGIQGPLPSFPMIYTTDQVNIKYRKYLKFVRVTSCTELLPP